MGHYNSFLVKIWSDENEKLVRGQIQHAGTQDIVYFRTWKKMIQFVVGRLGMNGELKPEEGAESKTSEIFHGE